MKNDLSKQLIILCHSDYWTDGLSCINCWEFNLQQNIRFYKLVMCKNLHF